MISAARHRRSQDGKTGQARTRLARAAVVQAARTLFLERGYAGTTIDAISDRSDVPPATVYRLFSSKLGILKALLDVSIAGDDEPMPVDDRPHVRVRFLRTRPDGASSPGLAGLTPSINVQDRARLPDPRERRGLRSRRRGAARRADATATPGPVPDRDVPWLAPAPCGRSCAQREAADIIHALMSPELYRLLVGRSRLVLRAVRTMAERHPHRPATSLADQPIIRIGQRSQPVL